MVQNNTVLSYDLNIPDTPSTGNDTLTRTIGHDKAVAAPGDFPNDQLDGNQSPSPDSGVAPNQSDYVVQKIPCAPVMNLYISGSEGGTTVGGYVVGDQLTCTQTGSASLPYQLVLWNGAVPSGPSSWVDIAGEFNTPLGTWTLGNTQGDQSSTTDWLNPYSHIGSTSGTITQAGSGGSIDATFSDGGGPITAKGSWTCPATA